MMTRRFLAQLLVLVLAACGGGGGGTAAVGSPATPAPTTPTATNGMRDLNATQLAREMAPGWNLGNSLEAIGGETAWGNPPVTRAFFDAVRAAGFRSVRLPVAWAQYADKADHIDPTWMARVAQAVADARAAGLYVIVNIHWDGGWIQPTAARQDAVNARLKTFWTQIATQFRDADDHLLFAGTNEVMVEGDYGPPTPEYAAAQNSFNQTFVSAVRATGGNNAVRHLVVQGFNTNIDHTLNFAVLPRDSASARLMMEVHYYDPYDFTLNDKSAIWQWGAIATDPAATAPWGGEAYADAQFQKMKTRFGDAGVPVILGEYGAIARLKIADAARFRTYWDRTITRSAVAHGLVPFYWDNGPTGDGSMGLFDRRTGQQVYPDLIAAIVGAAQ